MGQRVRRLSSPGGEESGEGEGQEERGGETGGGERREDRRRQAQLLQIHRELQNVEVILHVPPFFVYFIVYLSSSMSFTKDVVTWRFKAIYSNIERFTPFFKAGKLYFEYLSFRCKGFYFDIFTSKHVFTLFCT